MTSSFTSSSLSSSSGDDSGGTGSTLAQILGAVFGSAGGLSVLVIAKVLYNWQSSRKDKDTKVANAGTTVTMSNQGHTTWLCCVRSDAIVLERGGATTFVAKGGADATELTSFSHDDRKCNDST